MSRKLTSERKKIRRVKVFKLLAKLWKRERGQECQVNWSKKWRKTDKEIDHGKWISRRVLEDFPKEKIGKEKQLWKSQRKDVSAKFWDFRGENDVFFPEKTENCMGNRMLEALMLYR